MKSMYIGIDLGTTNSTIASFDGEAVNVIANPFGENLTPSVVRIDQRGGTTIGRRAYRFLETDPLNTRSEFKRLMGTETKLEFPVAQQSFLPEELSAQVLSSLLSDASDLLGYQPKRAVISTPALFELPQNHATMQAGKLAGLEEVVLIQEPIASAIAAGWRKELGGMWLIFDLGGGTLDVSLLETKDERLRVVDHGGDNFLGGKDFDNAMVDWALAKLHEQFGLSELRRDNPESRSILNRLKAACEQTKIELSRVQRSMISIPELCRDASGNSVEVELEITRADYEALIEPLVARGLSVCLALLEKAKVTTDEIIHVVFVGGPTLTPLLRRRIGDAFGGRIAEGIDPMTIVARGAALYAATAGLDARPNEPAAHPPVGLAVRVEYPPVTADAEPFVVGRFIPGPEESLPSKVRIERDDSQFSTPETAVTAEGTFVLQLQLQRHTRNLFHLGAFSEIGTHIPIQTPDFAIVHGVSIADPPLSRSVGIALSDDTVHVYFKKGIALPARKTFAHQTIRTVAAGSAEDLLSVPIIQGEFHRAHRNGLIGTLTIGGVKQTLPAGSRMEVTLYLDRSGQMQARADIPAIGQSFENIVHILVPTASLETLEQGLTSTEKRSADLLRKGFSTGEKAAVKILESVPGLMMEARRCIESARGDDPDAQQRLHRLLNEIDSALDAAEEAFEWPQLVNEANEQIQIAMAWVSGWGTPAEQRLLDQAMEKAAAALQTADALELDRQVKSIKAVTLAAIHRNPESVYYDFEWYEENITIATDLPRATDLINKGRVAAGNRDRDALRAINRQLYPLFPGTEEERSKSYGSGVH
jgi:molecular chaperone DnaK